MHNALRLFLLFFLSFTFAGKASSVELASTQESHSGISLQSDVLSGAHGGTAWFAIEIAPRTGWHAYWKNPGDSGAAPIFEWVMEEGGSVGMPLFPSPKRLPLGPLMNYGYDAPVTLLFPVQLPQDGRSVDGKVDAEWLICELECVPQFATLSFSLPLGDKVIDETARQSFITARNALPEPSYWDSKTVIKNDVTDLFVFMSSEEQSELSAAYFFPQSEGLADYAAEQSLKIGQDSLQLTLPRAGTDVAPANAHGIIHLKYGNGDTATYALEPTLELQLDTPSQSRMQPVAVEASLPLWQAITFALLGGLILNLMPCVFPILSLKAFAFVSANYKTAENRKKEGWAYTMGIWASFMIIVAVLILLRAGGNSIGWGFQLQEPVFVAMMVVLMVLVALSLSGMFSIQIGVEGAGQGLAAREGMRGAFFKGVLAALVATPCTAPLMAPAIGFALTQPLLIVFLVFTSLALGLALPFLALSYIPALARAMPRPGPWMEKVKEGLAFPMYLTAAWLLYIFDRQVGAVGTLMLLAAIILMIFSIWLRKQSAGTFLRIASWAIALLALIAILARPWETPERPTNAEHVAELAYSEESLIRAKGEGHPVFVYFTADWCITCKVNERLAIETDSTQKALSDAGVTVLKGDWTNRNSEIGEVLARFGRAGVPLYLFYPAGASDAVILPEILSPNAIPNIIAEHATQD